MKRALQTAGLCGVLTMLAWSAGADETEPTESSPFARTTIDIGVVVSDIDKSLAFYKDALGFTELDGFDVPAEFAATTGLAKQQPFHVHVLVLGDDESATKLKLMQFKQAPGRRIDKTYLHSSYGLSYLTVFVNDVPQALERAAKHGVKPISDGPVALPKGFPEGMGLAVVRDPDGNLIEFVGKLSR